ncbi:hypothetical protein GCWU000282_02571 [Catonella morbi ATCC 51271]|uniref:Nucleic acid-binding domain protein n=1 Tax=Catonella morbi ATCC 51271 TaxID=592026 RepID=V2Z676_9FIRM|nr:hypothetical protein GCWU000282_02571 [Catonella morbi ATCC 51271]
MKNDSVSLLHEEFDIIIDGLRKQGQRNDLPYARKEIDESVNIVGNIAGKVNVVERENKKGETFKVVNFSVVSNDSLGNKIYHNCSAYGEKGDIPKYFKPGDFVKLFGQVRISVDGNGKEHRNVNILSLKLLKAKEQNKEITAISEKEKLNNGIMGREKTERESVKDAIKKYKGKDNGMPQSRKEIIKEMKDKYLID